MIDGSHTRMKAPWKSAGRTTLTERIITLIALQGFVDNNRSHGDLLFAQTRITASSFSFYSFFFKRLDKISLSTWFCAFIKLFIE